MTKLLRVKRSLISAVLLAALTASSAFSFIPTAFAAESDTFTVTISGNKGVDLDAAELTVKRGENASVTANTAEGYNITKVQLNDGKNMESASVGTGQLLVAGKVYRIDEANGRVALRLTNVQSNLEVRFLAEIDPDYAFANQPFTVKISGEQGVKIDNSAINTTRGQTVDAVAYAAPGYQITKVRLEDGTHTESEYVSGKRIVLNGRVYPIENDSGYIKLHLTDIQSDMSVYFYADPIKDMGPGKPGGHPDKPNCKTFSIDVDGSTGIRLDNRQLDAVRGGDVNVVADAKRGYTIAKLRLSDRNHTATVSVSSGCIWFGSEKYLIDVDGNRVTLRLTDVQQNMSVYFFTNEDRVEIPEGCFGIDVVGDTGTTIGDALLSVKRGSSVNVSSNADSGYEIVKVRVSCGGHQSTANVSDGSIEVNGKTYRIDENNGRVIVRLTDVQQDMAVYFYTSTDEDNIPVIISEKSQNCSITTSTDYVQNGGTAIYTVSSANGYALDKITLRVGSSVASASVNAGVIKVGSKSYKIQASNDGAITVTVDDITERV